MKLSLGLAALVLLAAPAMAQEAGTATGQQIDPQAYVGLWHEVASTPMPFQAMCTGGTTALYELVDDETLRVLNRCDTAEGSAEVEGTAEVVGGNLNTFNVQFPQSPDDQGVNYVIVAVGEPAGGAYPWAAVHSPEGGYAWILSRTPELDAAEREAAEAALAGAGADVSALKDTAQPPKNYDPAQD
ncbi:lipocalin family protein [Paracoccus sp. S-4012]|uniref:lipocalin family protein n=1 Tax=Paracoccus sp. S-4012 TaxID=2665648 RepID=UPI001E4D1B07|nr:lipocalin family protein [Paracoccus sp. S-4012]